MPVGCYQGVDGPGQPEHGCDREESPSDAPDTSARRQGSADGARPPRSPEPPSAFVDPPHGGARLLLGQPDRIEIQALPGLHTGFVGQPGPDPAGRADT